MVLGSRVRTRDMAESTGPFPENGIGVTGGPNATNAVQMAHHRETMAMEANVLELLSKLQVTLGDPRVQQYTSAILKPSNSSIATRPELVTSPTSTLAVLDEDLQGGSKKRRGAAPPNTAASPAILVTPQQTSPSFTMPPLLPSCTPAVPSAASTAFPSHISPAPPPQFPFPATSPSSGRPVAVPPSPFPFFPTPAPHPSAQAVPPKGAAPSGGVAPSFPFPFFAPPSDRKISLIGTFDGLGGLGDLEVSGDVMSVPFRRMEDWWEAIPREERADIDQFLRDSKGLPSERTAQACMEKFHFTPLQCSWVRASWEANTQFKDSTPTTEFADMSFGGDIKTDCGVGDDWGEGKEGESKLPFCEDREEFTLDREDYTLDRIPLGDYGLRAYDYDDDMLTMHTTTEVPLGPTPLQHMLTPLSMQSPLQVRPMRGPAFRPLEFARGPPPKIVNTLKPATQHGQIPPAVLPYPTPVAWPLPVAQQTLPAKNEIPKPAPRKSKTQTVKPELSAREAYARAHQAELMNTNHPDHKKVFQRWNQIGDDQDRRKRPNFKKEAYEPLRAWFVAKIPYVDQASTKEKEALHESSGLSHAQIVRWISNNRIRAYLPSKAILDNLALQRDSELDQVRREQIVQTMYSKLFAKQRNGLLGA